MNGSRDISVLTPTLKRQISRRDSAENAKRAQLWIREAVSLESTPIVVNEKCAIMWTLTQHDVSAAAVAL